MPEIEIRRASAADILLLTDLDHTSTTDFLWKMELKSESGQEKIEAKFQKVQLPRKVKINYPKRVDLLPRDWQNFSGLLVATISGKPVAYISLVIDRLTGAVWVLDLIVDKSVRRQGIGSALLLAATEFAHEHGSRILIMEIQPRNGPAVALADKLGFDFCGFNDHYFPEDEAAIFFSKSI